MYNTAIESLLKSNTVDAAVEAALSHLVPIAGGLAIVLFILSTAFNFFMNSIKSLKGGEGGSFFDFEEFVRTIIIVAIIFSYKPVISTVTDLVDTLTKMTYVQEKIIQDLQAYADNMVTEASNPDSVIKIPGDNTNSEGNSNGNSALYDSNPKQREIGWFDKILGYIDPVTRINLLISSACAVILSIIRIIISAFMFVVYKVLICLGPFALAFSVLPMFRNQVDNWFGTLLGTGLVFVTLNILDVMFYEYVKNYITTANIIDNRINFISNIAFNLAIVISYLCAFWLTSKMIGKGDSGKILSKGVSLATMAAMAALSGGASSAGSGSSNSSNVGNVASSTEDAFKDKQGK
jgi:hypothetical protein